MESQLLELLALPASDNWPGTARVMLINGDGCDGPTGWHCTVHFADGGNKAFHGHTPSAAVDLAYIWAKNESGWNNGQ